MPMKIELIAGQLGINPEMVGEDLADHRDPDLPGYVEDGAARRYMRDVRRGQKRHELFMEAYDAARVSFMEGRNEAYRKAFDEAVKANKKQMKQYGVGARRSDALARGMAHEPAVAAAEAWDNHHQFPEPQNWARTAEGKKELARIDKQLDELELVAA
jgi:hypothetical protein